MANVLSMEELQQLRSFKEDFRARVMAMYLIGDGSRRYSMQEVAARFWGDENRGFTVSLFTRAYGFSNRNSGRYGAGSRFAREHGFTATYDDVYAFVCQYPQGTYDLDISFDDFLVRRHQQRTYTQPEQQTYTPPVQQTHTYISLEEAQRRKQEEERRLEELSAQWRDYTPPTPKPQTPEERARELRFEIIATIVCIVLLIFLVKFILAHVWAVILAVICAVATGYLTKQNKLDGIACALVILFLLHYGLKYEMISLLAANISRVCTIGAALVCLLSDL